jgi:beta-glucosidase
LIKALASVNRNLVVAMLAGGGVNMGPWIDEVPAVLHAWYPGMEGGEVIGEILFGDVNPSGRLPISIEKRWEDSSAYGNYDEDRASGKVYYREGILVGYRHFEKNKVQPLFPFGNGLSYTTFQYRDIRLDKEKIAKGQTIQISFTITNTGKKAGFEVAQLYISDLTSSVVRPVKELKGFEKIRLEPGETHHVTMTIDESHLAFYDIVSKAWKAEPGNFEALIGRSSADIRLKASFHLYE